MRPSGPGWSTPPQTSSPAPGTDASGTAEEPDRTQIPSLLMSLTMPTSSLAMPSPFASLQLQSRPIALAGAWLEFVSSGQVQPTV